MRVRRAVADLKVMDDLLAAEARPVMMTDDMRAMLARSIVAAKTLDELLPADFALRLGTVSRGR